MKYTKDSHRFTKPVLIAILALILGACESDVTGSEVGQADIQGGDSAELRSDAEIAPDPERSETERMDQSLADLEASIGIDVFKEPWTGDLDVMAQERQEAGDKKATGSRGIHSGCPRSINSGPDRR